MCICVLVCYAHLRFALGYELIRHFLSRSTLPNIHAAGHVTVDTVMALAPHMPNLEFFSFPFTAGNNRILHALSHFPRLRILRALGSHTQPLTHEGIQYLSALTHLGILRMGMCTLTAASISTITQLRHSLKKLSLLRCKITDKMSLCELSQLRKLRVFSVRYTPLTHEGLSAITLANTNLARLTLVNIKHLTSLECISLLPDLHILNISNNTQLDDRSIVPLTRLSTLHTLDIQCTRVSGVGLWGSQSIRSLTSLNFAGGTPHLPLTAEGVRAIAQFTK